MQTRVNYTVVGLFVVILTVALIATMFWLGSRHKGRAYKTYLTYLNEAVSGLNREAPVKFNGVQVGYVHEISLDPHNLQRVRLELRIDELIPITIDTRATLMSQGITGITYIGLQNISAKAPLLEIKDDEDYPVIPSVPSFLVQLDSIVKDIATGLKKVTDNADRINQTFNNLSEFTYTLAKNSQRVEEMLKNSETVFHNTAVASQEFPKVVDNMNRATQNLYASEQQVTTILNNLQQFSDEVKRHPSILLRDRKPAPLGPGER